MNRERVDDLPQWARIGLIAITKVGIPTIAAFGFWYLCDIQIKKQTEAFIDLRVTVENGFKNVKDSLDSQSRAYRRRDH